MMITPPARSGVTQEEGVFRSMRSDEILNPVDQNAQSRQFGVEANRISRFDAEGRSEDVLYRVLLIRASDRLGYCQGASCRVIGSRHPAVSFRPL